MNRFALPAVIVVFVLAVPFVWLWAATTRQGILTINPQTGNYVPVQKHRRQVVLEPPAKAVIDDEAATFDFGSMDPFDVKSHTFVIHNHGLGSLTLSRGGTTCKCTEFKILDRVVPPGGQGRVRVAWHPIKERGDLHEAVNIVTNDANHPMIKLSVHGSIRRIVAAEPAEILFPEILPGTSQSTRTVIYTQHWERFSISKVESSLAGLSWRVEPAQPEALAKLDAKCGYQITLTSPQDLPRGTRSDQLQLWIQPDDTDLEPRVFELAVITTVLGRLAVCGPAVTNKGEVQIGHLSPGQGAHVRLMLQVRDEQRDLPVTSIKTEPSFLEAEVTPYWNSGAARGLYNLDVSIPRDAPEGLFNGLRKGWLRLTFDHPRIKELKLDVIFAVVPKSR